jgi:type VI secretion system protein ImpF
MKAAFHDGGEFPLSLLDRLRDDRPRDRVEAPASLTCGERDYCETILRDIQWLLNTSSRVVIGTESPWNEVVCSTLNFGIPEVCGTTSAALAMRRWEQSVQRAVVQFEPRFKAESVRVRLCPQGVGTTPNQMVIEISAELVVAPIPLTFRVQIDRETAKVVIPTVQAGAA